MASNSAGQDGHGYGVFARRLERRRALASEFQVNTYTTPPSRPSVALEADGDFVSPGAAAEA